VINIQTSPSQMPFVTSFLM